MILNDFDAFCDPGNFPPRPLDASKVHVSVAKVYEAAEGVGVAHGLNQ